MTSDADVPAEVVGLIVLCPDCGSGVEVFVSPNGCAINGGNQNFGICSGCKGRIQAGWTSTGLAYGRLIRGPQQSRTP